MFGFLYSSLLSSTLLSIFGLRSKIGATGFEPATYWSQTSRASQAAPRPVKSPLRDRY